MHIIGFEPSINQRLLPPTFPRYTKIKSRVEAIIYFIEMVDRFKTVCKIQNIPSLHQALVMTEKYFLINFLIDNVPGFFH